MRPAVRAMLVLSAVVVGGCHKHPAPAPDFFGHSVLPPRGLDAVRPGMTVASARRALPALSPKLALDSGDPSIELGAFDDGGGIVRRLAAVFDDMQGPELEAMLTKSWGPPSYHAGDKGEAVTAWDDATTGWHAELDPCSSRCSVSFYRAFSPVYFGARAIPFGQLAKVQPGMTVTQAAAAAPELASRTDLMAEHSSVGTELTDAGIVRGTYIVLPEHARKPLLAAWGPGVSVASPTDPKAPARTVWFDDRVGWRATLADTAGQLRLYFEHYVPAAALLGDGLSIAALAIPLLGKSLAQVKDAYPTLVVDGLDNRISLPITELGTLETSVQLTVAELKVGSYTLSIPYVGIPAAKADLLALFTKKWGKPVPETDKSGKHYLQLSKTAWGQPLIYDDGSSWLVMMQAAP